MRCAARRAAPAVDFELRNCVTDRISKEARSRNMAAVRSHDTFPELYVRKTLYAAGYRYRLHVRKLPGSPDIVLGRRRVAVFVHGCFWHSHSCRRGRLPKTNREFWKVKIGANKLRDNRQIRKLRSSGWIAVVIWECRLERASRDLLALLERQRLPGAKAPVSRA